MLGSDSRREDGSQQERLRSGQAELQAPTDIQVDGPFLLGPGTLL